MAKFRSQQEIYNGIYKKENEYDTKIRGLQKIKEENEKVCNIQCILSYYVVLLIEYCIGILI
jgi:hypothetical protein